jgi:hypothetical protein
VLLCIFYPFKNSSLSIIYTVEVSIPYATAETEAALEYTTICLVASKTKPVLSTTPFGEIDMSYSIYSLVAGVAEADKDNRTNTVVDPLLQIETVATVKVVAGTVYNVVFVVADKLADPNIPDAIIFLHML